MAVINFNIDATEVTEINFTWVDQTYQTHLLQLIKLTCLITDKNYIYHMINKK